MRLTSELKLKDTARCKKHFSSLNVKINEKDLKEKEGNWSDIIQTKIK